MVGYANPRRRKQRPQPGQGQGPIVAPEPPLPRRGYADPRAAAEPTRGRVVAVFGPPGSGVSTLVRCLCDAAETRTAVLQPGEGDLEDEVRRLRADVIFLDGFPPCKRGADGLITGPDAIQYLYDRRLVFPGYGAVVRVAFDPELSIRQGRATPGGVHAWFAGLSATEQHIRMLGLPYFVVHNEPGERGLEMAVGELARRASVLR